MSSEEWTQLLGFYGEDFGLLSHLPGLEAVIIVLAHKPIFTSKKAILAMFNPHNLKVSSSREWTVICTFSYNLKLR